MDFPSLFINGIPLMVVIFGLVEFSKSLGLAGRWLTALSLTLGLVFGILYQGAISGFPVTFTGWFGIVVFSLALGLMASGFYDFANKRFPEVK